MSTNHNPDNQEHVSRREAMRRGVWGAAGMIAAGGLSSRVFAAEAEKTPEQKAAEEKAARDEAAKAKAKAKKVQTKSVIQIFLWGGMSHNDTWDPKPGAGYDYMGEFDKVIPTNVDGIQLGALFPKLAKQADKYSLIRSMTHGNNGHETAAYLMQTGHVPGGRLAYPSVGAIFAFFKKDQYKGLIPPYVVMLEAAGRFSEEGFLGPAYKPFATGGDPNAARFEVEGIVNRGIDDERQKARRELLDKINLLGYGLADVPEMAAAEDGQAESLRVDPGQGEGSVRSRQRTYGTQGSLRPAHVRAGMPGGAADGRGGCALRHHQLPRRLGHARQPLRDHAAHSVRMLDQGLATLLADLSDRGLLESTLVWCTGEFGRTPKVAWEPPWNGGRNHYGDVFTVLVAGGGFKGGRVVGSSDEKGEEVKERPVYPVDLLGSIYLLAGIDATAKLPHPWGLDAHVLDTENEGMKSAGLLEEIM